MSPHIGHMRGAKLQVKRHGDEAPGIFLPFLCGGNASSSFLGLVACVPAAAGEWGLADIVPSVEEEARSWFQGPDLISTRHVGGGERTHGLLENGLSNARKAHLFRGPCAYTVEEINDVLEGFSTAALSIS